MYSHLDDKVKRLLDTSWEIERSAKNYFLTLDISNDIRSFGPNKKSVYYWGIPEGVYSNSQDILRNTYNLWYNESMKVVEKHAPSNLDCFKAEYIKIIDCIGLLSYIPKEINPSENQTIFKLFIKSLKIQISIVHDISNVIGAYDIESFQLETVKKESIPSGIVINTSNINNISIEQKNEIIVEFLKSTIDDSIEDIKSIVQNDDADNKEEIISILDEILDEEKTGKTWLCSKFKVIKNLLKDSSQCMPIITFIIKMLMKNS
ncbi:hypothetical protein [Methanolobus sp.]|uniref:hypothetical protein n=1 Tax=Methanolobus sp. TaxID=1874737 RepID=UPI0025FD2179|nr:hypothetical protein [Methanolobus sp.]